VQLLAVTQITSMMQQEMEEITVKFRVEDFQEA
jgi:hypothetical protein